MDFSLGKDFWNYRMGQMVSLLGDACSSIALAWWILDKTGSAAAMSSVLAPAAVVRIALLPLFGPLGDNFSRKNLIIFADAWRFIFTSLLAAMVFFNYFNLPILIGAFILISGGSALFAAASDGIVSQIVARNQLQTASQQTQAINSFAGIIGGIIGGAVVSALGVFGAFAIDAVSYLAAGICSALIGADTTPIRKEKSKHTSAIVHWKNELLGGFRILHKIPVLFWICIVAMFMNLCLSPLGIILPVLAKEGRGMPAWFLGGLESSIGLGAVVGAVSFSKVHSSFRPHIFLVLSIAMMGVGVVLLPWVPNLLLPLSVLFWIGVGSSWANIPIGTQVALTVPDVYRSRVGSIMGFLCRGISPLGIAGAGYLISTLGLNRALVLMGLFLILLTPLMLFIPLIEEFLSTDPNTADTFLENNFPDVFAAIPNAVKDSS